MMDKETLQQQLVTVPEEIKSYIKEGAWKLILEEILKEQSLTPDQRLVIENEILFILLGMELSTDLNNNVKSQLSIDGGVIDNLCNKIKEKIFEPLSSYLPTEKELDVEENIPKETPIVTDSVAQTAEPQITTKNQEPEKPTLTSIPNYSSYDSGKDPYREPIE